MKHFTPYIILLALALSTQVMAQKQDLQVYEPLRGQWKFSIGDQQEWMAYDYNDSHWEDVYVPGAWEQQGFNGYDGYAWYRTSFDLPADASERDLWLDLGYIDDVDECYLNGKLIGSSGTFPPNHQTAYNARRLYQLHRDDLIYGGKNIIAVRVYDSYNEGGIVSGKIGIWENQYPLIPDQNLSGKWKFKIGDQRHYSDIDINDDNWNELYVPGAWEDQGFEHYDGMAWYRKTITINSELSKESLVLLLGKIDDVDEVFINGVMIGNTGLIEPHNFVYGNAYKSLRGYIIPNELVQNSKTLTIAVRVYDARLTGGIYEGPVGLIAQDKYIKYWIKQRNAQL